MIVHRAISPWSWFRYLLWPRASTDARTRVWTEACLLGFQKHGVMFPPEHEQERGVAVSLTKKSAWPVGVLGLSEGLRDHGRGAVETAS